MAIVEAGRANVDQAGPAQVRAVVRDGFESVLLPRGFDRVRKTQSWFRTAGTVGHVLDVRLVRGSYHVQWAVTCPPAALVIWDADVVGSDVAHGVITSSLVGAFFSLEDLARVGVVATAERVSGEVAGLLSTLDGLDGAPAVIDYLLANTDAKDRRFLVPSNLPLKWLTAAALAVTSNDPRAALLAAEAEVALRPFKDKLNRRRLTLLADSLKD